MKVLFVSAEAVPFAKVGGLADVVGALPLALQNLGVQVRLILPKYKAINPEQFGIRKLEANPIQVPLGPRTMRADLYHTTLPGSQVKTYFVANDYFFGREGIYDDIQTKTGYPDNGERFTLFMKAALAAVGTVDWKPDVIHCHDHQTALIPAYLKLTHRSDPLFRQVATLFTIHNLAYQGLFPKEILHTAGFTDELFYPKGPFEFWGKVNFMKAGIVFADVINTVSEKYAQEIQSTKEFGMGLEDLLRERKDDLYGILNGIDYTIWNPETDKLIPYNYSVRDLSGKRLNKLALLKRVNLPSLQPSPPLIGMISRLTDQKGFDLVAEKIDSILSFGVQMVILGTGQQEYHELLTNIVKQYPTQVAVSFGFDDPLAHLIEAGSDMFLMPSRFEPCGLNQMYSLKYGTVPIVRTTGGLADTIEEFDPGSKKGNGFCFYDYSASELVQAVQRAVTIYTHNKEAWRVITTNGMNQDYSWTRSAEKYIALYEKAIKKHKT